MRLIRWITFAVILAMFFWIGCALFFNEDKQPVWDQKRLIRYGFELKNTQSDSQKNVIFKAHVPIALTATQKVTTIESTHDYEIQTDELNNQTMVFEIPHILPYGILNIGVTVELMLSSVSAQDYQKHSLYSAAQPLIETGDVAVMQLANQLANQSISSDREKPLVIYEWMVENIEYSGYGFADKGAAFAVNYLHGDCTEFAYLGTALGRLMGVPSRAVNGYIVDSDSKLKISNYHTWTEMWFDGSWQVVDAQAQNYLTHQEDYLAMSIYQSTDQLKKPFEQFWISNTDIKVRMD